MRPYVVLDASVAGAWSFAETYSLQAQPVLNAIVAHRVNAIAPDRFIEEVLRVCQKKTQAVPPSGAVSPSDAWDRFIDVVTSPIYFVPSDELHERAWLLALATGLTTHDALYLAAAELWDAELWTLDAQIGALLPVGYPMVRDLRSTTFPY